MRRAGQFALLFCLAAGLASPKGKKAATAPWSFGNGPTSWYWRAAWDT
jgi:hypothetical protein